MDYCLLESNLVGDWRIGSASGTTVRDRSSLKNDMTLYSANGGFPTYKMDPVQDRPVLDFDSKGYGAVTSQAAYYGAQYSVEFSMKLDILPTVAGRVYIVVMLANSGTPSYSWQFYVSSSSDRLWFVHYSKTPTIKQVYSNDPLAINTRYHFIVTCDASHVLKMYVNGILQNITQTNDDDPATADSYLLLSHPGASRLDGQISLFRIYNKALSQPEVTAAYHDAWRRVSFKKSASSYLYLPS
jgi:hypothetical protein